MQTLVPLVTFIFLSLSTLAACTSSEKKQAVHNTIEQPASTTKATATKPPKQQAKKRTGFTFLAQGTEPFWAVDVAKNNLLTFSTPENPEGIKLKARRSAYAKGSEYYGTYRGAKFYLNIRSQHCEDTMADQTYDMRAKFEFNGKKYTGCAKVK